MSINNEGKFGMEDVYMELILHQKEHKLPLWEKDIVMNEQNKHICNGPSNQRGYAFIELIDEPCRKLSMSYFIGKTRSFIASGKTM